MKLQWKTCFKVGITVLVLYLFIYYWSTLANGIQALFKAAAPLFVGGAMAYVLNILMGFYEKHYFTKTKRKALNRSRRPVCLLLALATVIVIVVLLIRLVVPELISCIQLIFERLPMAVDIIAKQLKEWGILSAESDISFATLDWKAIIEQVINVISSGVGDVMEKAVTAIVSVFSGIVTAVLSFIFSIYILVGKERLASQCNRLMVRYIKGKWYQKIMHVLGTMNGCFRKFIIGQCTEAFILGALCTVGMLILRLPYATMIGVLIGVTALIPVAGAYIGAAVGALMILTVSPFKAVIFLIFILILQQIEGNVIYPKVVGTSLGLPPFWVLAAVVVSGGVMGVIGMLFGVPLAATIYKLLKEDVNKVPKTT